MPTKVSIGFHLERSQAVSSFKIILLLSEQRTRNFRSAWLYALGIGLLNTFSILTGLIMYAKYSTCDPFTTGEVKRNDQLLPYYVMDVAGNVPGLPGLFIAGVVSAALRYESNKASQIRR